MVTWQLPVLLSGILTIDGATLRHLFSRDVGFLFFLFCFGHKVVLSVELRISYVWKTASKDI